MAPHKVGDRVQWVDPFTLHWVHGTIRGFLGGRAAVETTGGWVYVPVRSLSPETHPR
jgi:hypothetical protein